MDAGQAMRDVLARCAAVRAYGVAPRPPVDFIDVPFEDVQSAADARSLPSACSGMRPARLALPG